MERLPGTQEPEPNRPLTGMEYVLLREGVMTAQVYAEISSYLRNTGVSNYQDVADKMTERAFEHGREMWTRMVPENITQALNQFELPAPERTE